MSLFGGLSIQKWFFSISIPPPYVIVVRFLSPPTKSVMWREVAIRPLSNKYCFAIKIYAHILDWNTLFKMD